MNGFFTDIITEKFNAILVKKKKIYVGILPFKKYEILSIVQFPSYPYHTPGHMSLTILKAYQKYKGNSRKYFLDIIY
jgi:hypothetical protein